MAATTTFGVTNLAVIDETPLSPAQIDATSEIVNTEHIDQWIQEAAGTCCSILTGRGVSPTTVDADGDAEMLCVKAIKSYAAAKTLRKMNSALGLAQQLWDEYLQALDLLRNSTSDLGGTEGSILRSNINTTSPSPTAWRNADGTGDTDIW